MSRLIHSLTACLTLNRMQSLMVGRKTKEKIKKSNFQVRALVERLRQPIHDPKVPGSIPARNKNLSYVSLIDVIG